MFENMYHACITCVIKCLTIFILFQISYSPIWWQYM